MPPRARKKAKKSTIASKDVVLKALVGMPMDIVFEIFGYLDPLDLLRLARTTKALRAILMSRSSSSLWKRVRRAYYQMPDGPEGMSEPQYISLALDLICDGCGVSSTDNCHVYTYWNAELKSCHKCESALLVNESDLKKLGFSAKLPSWLLVLLQYMINRRISYSSYSLEQAQIWSQEYASFNGSYANLTEWERRIYEKKKLTKKHQKSFDLWTQVREREMSAERSQLFEATNKALLAKLEELGWSEEISKMHSHESSSIYYTLLKKEKLGTFAQVWSSNGRAMLKAIKARQTARIEKEWQMLLCSRYAVLQKIYDGYIRGLPADSLTPTVADVALYPPVNAIITDERTDFIVTQQTFEDINLVQTLPSIVSDWKVRLDDELVRMVQFKLSEPFTKDQLLLATTVFYCDFCQMDLFYPRVLVHECSTPYRSYPSQYLAWNSSGNIKFDRNVYQAAIDIVNILGFDPKAVTYEDMIVSNRILQCLDCRATRQGRMTMFWSRVIEHCRKEHFCLPSMISWKVPGHDGQALLAHAFASAATDHLDSVQLRFMCGVCRQKETYSGLKQHLSLMHKIRNPHEHHILFHPDAIQAPMPYVLPKTD